MLAKIPWRRKWQATPVSLPGKSHGQRSHESQRVGHDSTDTLRTTATSVDFWVNIRLVHPQAANAGVLCETEGSMHWTVCPHLC